MVRHFTSGLTPFLKWAGGKRWFVHRYSDVLSHLIAGRRVVEPFAGAGAFSLALSSKKALLNDVNPHLINVYQQIQTGNFYLPEHIPIERGYYEGLRQEFNDGIAQGVLSGPRPAQLFWLLNRLGFNGLCRFNKKGFFNTPFGRYHKIYRDFDWHSYQQLFQEWDFTLGSFDSVATAPQDFIFCDPPYDVAWQGYYHNSFSFEQQEALAHWVASQQAPALIMNHPTERILALYQSLNFEIALIPAPRTLAAQAGSRKKRLEVIATHNFSWKQSLKKV